jgi:hypothetical protein
MRKPAGTTQSIVIFTDVLTHPAPAQLKSRDYGSRRFLLSMNAEKINLRNVTLCAVGCLNPALTARALDISKRHCLFGDSFS